MDGEVRSAGRERPILFSGPLVRALLAGTKTQTRRLVRPMPGRQSQWLDDRYLSLVPSMKLARADGRFGAAMEHPRGGPGGWVACPYGEPRDRLWVRETWQQVDMRDRGGGASTSLYRADFVPRYGAWERDEHDGRVLRLESKWTPAIHMPRWASRIVLEVTDVRVERLQEITEADARAEGVTLDAVRGTINGEPAMLHPMQHTQAFMWLWNSINAKRAAWHENPWVWVVSFRRSVAAV